MFFILDSEIVMGRIADMTPAQLRAYKKYRLKMRTDYNTDPSEHARVTEYNRAWRQRNKEVDNIRTRARYYRRVAREHESCVYMAYSPSDPSFVKIGQTCVPTLRMKFFKIQKHDFACHAMLCITTNRKWIRRIV
jgi:hypothetical protein